MRLSWRTALVGLAIFVPCAAFVITLTCDPTTWVDLLFDDAYYYLGIAAHIATEFKSSFAPPLTTNGYQPLWLAILSVSAFLVGGNRVALAASVHLISLAIIIAFLVLSKRQHGKPWVAALTVLVHPLVTLSGMETILIFPLALLYFEASGWKRGAFASLLFLSRLDALGLIAGRELYQIIVRRRLDARAAIVVIAVVLAYATFNWAAFGLLVPVSGLAKAVGSTPGENWRVGLYSLALALPMTSVLAWVWLTKKNISAIHRPEPLFACLAAILASAIYYGVFSGWITWAWYNWPAILLFYYFVLELADAERSLMRAAGSLIVGVACLVAPLSYITSFGPPVLAALGRKPRPSWGWANVTYAEQVRPPVTLAMGDRAGSLGYFLPNGVRLIQTEGLVADRQYLQSLRSNRGEQFLVQAGVDFLVVDRGIYWVSTDNYAVPEPIQGLSARTGIMLLCFPRSAVSTPVPERTALKVFSFRKRTVCPADLLSRFQSLQNKYSGIRQASLWANPQMTFFGIAMD